LGDTHRDAKEAVPALIEALDKQKDEVLRWHVARALGSFGANAAAAVPKLTDCLTDSSGLVRAYAAYALGRIGSDSTSAIPALVTALEDSDPTVRRMVVKAIVAIKPPQDVIMPVMIETLKRSEPGAILPALQSLAEAGEPAIPLLVDAMKDPRARYWACLVLASLGPQANGALAPLVEATKDSDPGVRREALLALGEIGPEAASAVPAMVVALDDKKSAVRAAAAFALGKLGPAAKDAIGPLKKKAADQDSLLRTISVWSLARIEPSNSAFRNLAMPVLLESLASKNPRVRSAAIHALADLRTGDDRVIPALIGALKDGDTSVSNVAYRALADLGETAVSALSAALGKPETRELAALSLAHIGPKAKAAVPALVAALDDPAPHVRRVVLTALAAVGPEAGHLAAGPVAKRLDMDTDVRVRQAAAFALGQFGAQPPSVPALRKAVRTGHQNLAVTAALSLAQLDPNTDQTVRLVLPVLTAGLKADRSAVRIEAAHGLAALGQRASDAIIALNESLVDDNIDVRHAAAEALERIRR
ncbi:MAG TPA: HEAT repeat domain-containing protein, partial [Pirellulales bacterium]|nr:HEAT repeat domain-containing protein [Pirellulales bacterium]